MKLYNYSYYLCKKKLYILTLYHAKIVLISKVKQLFINRIKRKEKFFNLERQRKYLILTTHDKIEKQPKIVAFNCVEFYGFLYLSCA